MTSVGCTRNTVALMSRVIQAVDTSLPKAELVSQPTIGEGPHSRIYTWSASPMDVRSAVAPSHKLHRIGRVVGTMSSG